MKDEGKPLLPELSTGEVARIFNVSPGTIRRWCEQGKLKAYRSGPGCHRQFLRFDVATAYLERSIQGYLHSLWRSPEK